MRGAEDNTSHRLNQRVALTLVQSNDLVAYEDLIVKNMVKNHCLAKSINDVAWRLFRQWLEYFSKKYGRLAIAVKPHYTSQICSNCGAIVKKTLSQRTHTCKCGCTLQRDVNAAINILERARGGHPVKSRSGSSNLYSTWGNPGRASNYDELRIPVSSDLGVSMSKFTCDGIVALTSSQK